MDPLNWDERIKKLAIVSIYTAVPIVAVCCYVEELYGYNQKFREYKDDIMKPPCGCWWSALRGRPRR